jgi:hypothetical protein
VSQVAVLEGDIPDKGEIAVEFEYHDSMKQCSKFLASSMSHILPLILLFA